jgi:hypothetical protein
LQLVFDYVLIPPAEAIVEVANAKSI